jgi:hypothetical protein
MKQFRALIILLFVLCSKNLLATGQFGDVLIINGKTVEVFSNPLEQYFEKKGNRTIGKIDMNEEGGCTALWRGYVATWELKNDSLFLVRIEINYCDKPKEINLKNEFGSKKVFADWVNCTIICPKGELLEYVHMGYASIYEEEKHYIFEQGKLVGTEIINYLERDNNLLFPGIDFLHDTIWTLIIKSISEVEMDSIDADFCGFLYINFDENGEISRIGFSEKEPRNISEEIILRKAKEVLKGFPKLMKVNHEWYQPPVVSLWFNVHCIKFPDSKECMWDYEKPISTLIYFLLIGLLAILILFSIYIIKKNKQKRKKNNNTATN